MCYEDEDDYALQNGYGLCVHQGFVFRNVMVLKVVEPPIVLPSGIHVAFLQDPPVLCSHFTSDFGSEVKFPLHARHAQQVYIINPL